MTDISDIPTASQLQQQLQALYNAIDSLSIAGTNIPNMTVMPAASSDPMASFIMPYGLTLNPPITNPQTLTTVQNALVSRATDLENQLVAMGYSNDTNRPPVTPPPIS